MAANASCRTWLDGNHTAVTLISVQIRFTMVTASLSCAEAPSPKCRCCADMKKVHHILVFLLLPLACAYGQMTIISTRAADPEVRPEQRTATIVHYEKMRLTARSTIRVLALALQNTEGGPTARLNDALNNEQDIVDWANWCILALRDKTTEAVTCAFPPRLGDETRSESICQVAENSRLHCSGRPASAKRTQSSDTTPN